MFVDTNRFIIRKYVIESPKITEEKRVVLIADLHNKQFDEGNGKLLAAIDKISTPGSLICPITFITSPLKL